MNNDIKRVFVLQHEYEKNGSDRVKHIGVFLSRGEAEAVVAELREQPGFKLWPNGFEIFEAVLGEYTWKEGFGPSEKLLKLIEDAGVEDDR
jgi:homoserine kinase type II